MHNWFIHDNNAKHYVDGENSKNDDKNQRWKNNKEIKMHRRIERRQ